MVESIHFIPEPTLLPTDPGLLEQLRQQALLNFYAEDAKYAPLTVSLGTNTSTPWAALATARSLTLALSHLVEAGEVAPTLDR